MYGMPLSQALVFLLSVVFLFVATQWRRFHPFLVILFIAAAFGYIAGFPTAQLGSDFGNGFSEKSYSPGLVIVAAALIAGLAEGTAVSDRLMTKIDRWQRFGSNRIAGILGLIAGIGASPAVAFALLMPLLPALGGAKPPRQQGATIALALAISASHGLLLTPVLIAAVAILGAPWHRAALFGVPLAILLVGFGATFARWPSPARAATAPPTAAPETNAAKQTGGSVIVLLLAIAVPLLLLMVQSLGDIPSEPLGGGPTRELILGVGRPLILFLVGVGIMIVGHPRQGLGLVADPAWTGRVFGGISNTLLIVCAAGGLQRLCQQTGMAEMAGERLLDWHIGELGVLVPFLIAAAMKTLQGSSPVAAITAAGMVQPILLPLGLGDANGRALAALAVGIGAMTISHINDEYFWLVTQSARFTPLRGFATLSVGTLLQGLFAAAALLILSLVVSHT